VDLDEMEQTDSGLFLQVLEEGQYEPAVRGQRVSIEYMTWLVDGTPVDSALAADPFVVILGDDFMVDGFMEGIEDIRMGEQRLLVVKPELGFGGELVPDIPRDSWLVYRVRRVPPG